MGTAINILICPLLEISKNRTQNHPPEIISVIHVFHIPVNPRGKATSEG